MAIKELPTVNFDSNPGYDEFKFLHSIYSEEFKNRSIIATSWGIVDTGYDPATAPFSGSRALNVSVSPVNTQTIDISAGFAVASSHLLIDINATVPSVPLPNIEAGKVYVIAVEYNLVSSDQTRVNRYGILSEVRLERPSNVPIGGGASTLTEAITVVDINDYNNTGIFDAERKSNVVVIGIVTVQTNLDTGQLYLSVDLTRNTYAFNRPWFSTRDVSHRSKIGSGLITENNPHGTELQDLSSAGLTLYQQIRPRGGILAKDISYFGYPGKICTEGITLARWEVDLTGAITGGLAGRYYVRLTKLPIRTGSLFLSGKPWLPVPYEWIPGTRVLILGALEKPSTYEDSLVFEYFTVDALEVNAESPTQGLQFLEVKSPVNSQEFIISGGLAISELTQTSLSLPATLGPIMRNYLLVCDGLGSLVLNPQPLLASVKVSDIQGTTQTVNQAPHNGNSVYLTLGLTKALERITVNPTTTYDLDLKVRLTGVGTNGNAQSEVLTFKGSQWKDQTAGSGVEEPLQFIRTLYKYQLVSTIALANTLSEPHNAGPEAQLALWAEALDGSDNQEFASIASFFWTGTTGINVRDERFISTSLDKLDQKESRFPAELPDTNLTSVPELYSVILYPPLTDPTTPPVRLMLEIDDDREWGETWEEFSTTGASGQILLTEPSYITIGETIRLGRDKVLIVVPPVDTTSQATIDATTAVASLGEVNFPPIVSGSPSSDIFRNNAIATINDPQWDSTWFASLGSGANPPIRLARENAYPEGYIVNYRQKIAFTSLFGAGDSFSFKIDGILIGPVAFTTSNNDFFDDLVAVVNAATITTDVSASIIYPFTMGSDYTAIVLNGNANGDTFVVSDLNPSGGAPAGLLSDPLEAFVLTQPVGGILPTPHLPQRYPSALIPWGYQSRPLLWSGVGLQASIGFTNVALIGNGDAVEIAPNKIIRARVGSGANADPTIGEFLVDSVSLINTLNNMVATITHPVFRSGVAAEVSGGGTEVLLHSGGMAATVLRQVVETLSGTWILTTQDGSTKYLPQGRGEGHIFLKTKQPLYSAEWRWTTLENRNWVPWVPMVNVSPTAFKMESPLAQNLYQIQVKLSGGIANSFSMYEYTPEVSGATVGALDIRLTDTEDEISDARGTAPDLASRLVNVVELDGTRIQDTELTDCEESVILPESQSIKDHLDVIDTLIHHVSSGGLSPKEAVVLANKGVPSTLLSGPQPFMSSLGSIVSIGGSVPTPLAVQIQGYNYSYTRQVQLEFSGAVANTYFIYLDHASSTYGLEITTGTVSLPNLGAVEGSSVFTDPAANFISAGVKEGHLLHIEDIEVGGFTPPLPLILPITSVTTTQIGFAGKMPSNLVPATYKVYSPREGTFGYTDTRVDSLTRAYLGEVVYSGGVGGTLSDLICYRHENKYTGPVTYVDAAGNYSVVFNHNLGFLPKHFVLYFYVDLTGSPTGDPKVLHIGDECVVKVTRTTMTVRNRYVDLVARDYSGVTHITGHIQLMI